MNDPRILIAARAAKGAAQQRRANAPKATPKPAQRLRTGRRTAQAIAALRNLRNDLALGLPPAALIERIDDELFKLTKKP